MTDLDEIMSGSGGDSVVDIPTQPPEPQNRHQQNRSSARFTERVLVRCPASLPPAIDRAAAKNLMTASEYVRRAVINGLKADGIDPGALDGAA